MKILNSLFLSFSSTRIGASHWQGILKSRNLPGYHLYWPFPQSHFVFLLRLQLYRMQHLLFSHLLPMWDSRAYPSFPPGPGPKGLNLKI